MTRSEFVTESLSFPPGKIIVVSGQNFSMVNSLLVDAMTAIEGATSNLALVYDSRSSLIYDRRDFQSNVLQARVWEYMAIMAEGQFILLVANQFDPADKTQNPTPRGIIPDVVSDLMYNFRVRNLDYAYESKYGMTRELYAFVTHLYFYDTNLDEVTFIKHQTPDRP